jgi:hypothetical protein
MRARTRSARRWNIILFKVASKPGKSLNPISDEWGDIEIEGEVFANNLDKFATWTGREQVPDLGSDE